VWWAGNEEYFECTIKDWHVAVGAEGSLFYTHRCEYDGGTFDHDLSRATFEVIEVKQARSPQASQGEGALQRSPLSGSPPKSGLNFMPLSPRRRWLAKQESQLKEFSEDLEQADIATPAADVQHLRGRGFMRRMRQPQAETPRTPRHADVDIIDPSDVDITYRLPANATPARAALPGKPATATTVE